MTRHYRRWIIIGITAIAAGTLLYNLSQTQPIEAKVWQVKQGTVESTVTNTRAGTVKPCRRAHISPAMGGPVAKLHVKKGETVKLGQILVTLWNEDLEAQIRLAQRELAASRVRATESCLLAEEAQREADRVIRLKKQNLVSEEQIDQATTESKARAISCKAARAASRVAETRITVAEANRDRTLLTAPFAGIVAEINTEVGEYITPSPPGIPTLPAIDLIDASCLYVSAPIDEIDAPAIRTGMPAYVTLDAIAGKRFDGVVRRIAPYVQDREKQARTVEIEVEVTEVERISNLLAGYSADIEVVLATRNSVVRIPSEAILGGNQVLLLNEANQTLETRIITPGLGNWSYTEVTEGLKEGQRIVLSLDLEGIEAGAKIKPIVTDSR